MTHDFAFDLHFCNCYLTPNEMVMSNQNRMKAITPVIKRHHHVKTQKKILIVTDLNGVTLLAELFPHD